MLNRIVFALTAGLIVTLRPAAALADLSAQVQFNIAAQQLSAALLKYSEQSGVQITSPGKLIEGKSSADVVGKLPARDGLERLLKGTNLAYEVIDSNTILIRAMDRKSDASRTANLTFAQADQTMQKVEKAESSVEDASKKDATTSLSEARTGDDESSSATGIHEVLITGTRIRSVAGEQNIQPVLTITSRDIERFGISSLGEVFRYIPQVSSYASGQAITASPLTASGFPNGAVARLDTGRVTATLRGAPAGGTLLLINGRRAPKNGQQSGADGYDIGGIPLSAVERIDVLLDGASAIYGADAVGGVINVILKRHYSGTQMRLGFENTFEQDASIKSASVAQGFSSGKLSALLTFAVDEANAMMWKDRDFLATVDRRALGGSDSRSTASVAGSGRISSTSGNLPGLSSGSAAIPTGSTGVGLTVQSYANAGPSPGILDIGQFLQYSTPYERWSFVGSVDFEVAANTSLFADVRSGRNRNTSTFGPLRLANGTIPAGAPGNPFAAPILLSKYFWDLPWPTTTSTTGNDALVAGVRGAFARDWRYEASLGRTSTDADLNSTAGTSIDTSLLAAALAGPTPPVLLYDSTTGNSPNPPGTIEALTATLRPRDREVGKSWTYDFKTDGSIWELPAGSLRVATGAEYREDYVDFPLQLATSTGARAKDRNTWGIHGEARIPVLGGARPLPLVHTLDVSLSVRHDRYSDFPATTNPRYGVLYRPVSWLALRGSFGEGSKLPTLSQLYAPTVLRTNFLFADADPLRGNESLLGRGAIPALTGGNPTLHPERSENLTAGLVWDVIWVGGLSLSVDYYESDYLDRVATIPLSTQMLLFPSTVTRGPRLITDPVGWAGPVVAVDIRALNVAVNRVAGYDVTANFNTATSFGDLTLRTVLSKATRNEVRAVEGGPVNPQTTSDSLPLQVFGSIFWSRGPVELGALCTYRDRFRGINLASAPFTPSAIGWDFHASYDFSRSTNVIETDWLKRLLVGTRLGLTVFNVWDEMPPMGPGGMPNNATVDSRLRRYSVQMSKTF